MTIEFKLPAVGENVAKADIGQVLVKEGDTLTPEQVVLEVETDKAVFELPCPHGGTVKKVHVKSGDSVSVGATLLTIEEGASATTEAKPDKAPAAGKAEERPAKKEPAPESAPEKAAAKAPAAKEPEEKKPAPEPARAATATESHPSAPSAKPEGDATEGNGEAKPPAPAGPATRRLARELGVDLHRVSGTGPGGRITPEDVQAFVRTLTSAAASGSGSGTALQVPPLPDFSKFGTVERQPMSKLMRTAATNLTLAWNVIPHVTQHELADITDLESGRKRFGQSNAGNASVPKITMTVLALKAVITALKSFPHVNSSLDTTTNELILKRYYNIGIAVDTEQGLLVPVVRDADKKSIWELAAEVAELANKARNRKLTLNDMQGGTFTITNLGGIGGTFFTPIVNYPEVAILGMSRAQQQQVIVNGKPEIRLMLPLSLSYDHRVINGADAARFIVKVSGLLSDPFDFLSEI